MFETARFGGLMVDGCFTFFIIFIPWLGWLETTNYCRHPIKVQPKSGICSRAKNCFPCELAEGRYFLHLSSNAHWGSNMATERVPLIDIFPI